MGHSSCRRETQYVTKYIAAYVATLVVMLALDGLWIGVLAKSLYREGIGHLMAAKPDLRAAALFYVVYISGLMVFAILPNASEAWTRTAMTAGFFGFVAYATFDLTSQALLKDWPWSVTIADLVWGTFISAASATAGKLVFDRLA